MENKYIFFFGFQLEETHLIGGEFERNPTRIQMHTHTRTLPSYVLQQKWHNLRDATTTIGLIKSN